MKTAHKFAVLLGAVGLMCGGVQVVQANKLVDFDFEITTPLGQPVTILNGNDPFVFIVRARDLRDNPRTVFAAYLDVIYEGTGLTPGEVQITGPIDFNELVYPSSQKGTTTTVGLIDEVGAIDGISSPPAPTGAELFRVPMLATRVGVVSFTGNPADSLPFNEVVLRGGSGPVPAEQQQFDAINLTIVPEPSSIVLLGLGGLGIAVSVWRRKARRLR